MGHGEPVARDKGIGARTCCPRQGNWGKDVLPATRELRHGGPVARDKKIGAWRTCCPRQENWGMADLLPATRELGHGGPVARHKRIGAWRTCCPPQENWGMADLRATKVAAERRPTGSRRCAAPPSAVMVVHSSSLSYTSLTSVRIHGR